MTAGRFTSIVIPVHNLLAHTRQCLESIFGMTARLANSS